MRFIKKFLFLFIFSLGVFIGSFSFADEDNGSNSEDFLEQAFSDALNADLLVGKNMMGTKKDTVGRYVLEGGKTFSFSKWVKGHNPWGEEDSLLTKISKFLVRMTLVLSITMIIYNGIIFVVKSTKGEPSKETMQNIVYICVGVLLALSSVIIIRLGYSVGSTTLKFEDEAIGTTTTQKTSYINNSNGFIS